MILICGQCRDRLGLERRMEVCPSCGKKTTWTEPLTANDKKFLRRMRILIDDDT